MFVNYTTPPDSVIKAAVHSINYFETGNDNIDIETVEAFGEEWSKFNQFSETEIEQLAKTHYFDIVPLEYIQNKKLLDVGCGTGRWTKYVAKYAATVDAIDPSKAIVVAAELLKDCTNIRLSRTSVNNLPFENESFDFVFSLGVLHHIPDTASAMQQSVNKLKKGGFFLVYLYYNLENRNSFFKWLFSLSNNIRKQICKLPPAAKNFICDIIAVFIYLPFVFVGTFIKFIGAKEFAKKIPLHFYLGKTYNVIRNDARDRFGTPLEQRFTKDEIRQMMQNCGLTEIVFSENEPYWHAIGEKN